MVIMATKATKSTKSSKSFDLVNVVMRQSRLEEPDEEPDENKPLASPHRDQLLAQLKSPNDLRNKSLFQFHPYLYLGYDRDLIVSAKLQTRHLPFNSRRHVNYDTIPIYGVAFKLPQREIFVGVSKIDYETGTIVSDKMPTPAELNTMVGKRLDSFRYNKECYPEKVVKFDQYTHRYYYRHFQKNIFRFFYTLNTGLGESEELKEEEITFSNSRVNLIRVPILVIDSANNRCIDRDMI